MPKQNTVKRLPKAALRPLAILIAISLVFVGWDIYHYTASGFGSDSKKAHDLAAITQVITDDYLTRDSALPMKLNGLYVKGLAYAIGPYDYKPLYGDMGSSAYDLCAQFHASQGLPFDSRYSNAGSFAVHRKGRQCFQVTYFPNHGASDITPILNNNEELTPD